MKSTNLARFLIEAEVSKEEQTDLVGTHTENALGRARGGGRTGRRHRSGCREQDKDG